MKAYWQNILTDFPHHYTNTTTHIGTAVTIYTLGQHLMIIFIINTSADYFLDSQVNHLVYKILKNSKRKKSHHSVPEPKVMSSNYLRQRTFSQLRSWKRRIFGIFALIIT